MKKPAAETYGTQLLLTVSDTIFRAEKPLCLAEIAIKAAKDQPPDEPQLLRRIRTACNTLVENKKVIRIEKQTRFKTTIHLYLWNK